MSDLAL
jgi:hypothetical protein